MFQNRALKDSSAARKSASRSLTHTHTHTHTLSLSPPPPPPHVFPGPTPYTDTSAHRIVGYQGSQEAQDPRDAHDEGQLDVDGHLAVLLLPQHARRGPLGARDVASRDEEEYDVEEEEDEERSGEEQEEGILVGEPADARAVARAQEGTGIEHLPQ